MRLQLLPLFCSSFDLETFQVDEFIRFLNQGFGFCCSFGGGGVLGGFFLDCPQLHMPYVNGPICCLKLS